MSTIVTRAGKGSPLTWTEVDDNFTNLNTDKYQSGSTASFAGLTISTATAGSVLFSGASGVVSQNNTGLFWDNSNARLGLNTVSPPLKLALLSGNATNNNSVPLVSLSSDRTDRYSSIDCVRGAVSSDIGIAFSTANTSGIAERMRIDSSGNVGIGITPIATVRLASYDTNATVYTSTGSTASPAGSVIAIGNLSNTNGGYSGISLGSYQAAGSSSSSYIGNISNTGSLTGTMVFGRRTASAAYAESMRIDSSGNVGISTTDPTGGASGYGADARILGIAGSGAAVIGSYGVLALQNNRASPASTDIFGGIGFISSGSVSGQTLKTAIQSYADGAGGVTGGFGGSLRFFTKPDNSTTQVTERMRIDSAGNVGIGVTPSASSGVKAFEIYSAGNGLISSAGSQAIVTANAYYNGGYKYGSTGLASNYTQLSGVHSWNVAASGTAGNAITFTQAMTLDANGDLGIGLTSPKTKLDVKSYYSYASAANGGIRLENYNSTVGSYIDNIGGLTIYNSSQYYGSGLRTPEETTSSGITFPTGNIQFYTNSGLTVGTNYTPTERMRIDSAGNVGIGVTPSAITSGYKGISIGGTGGNIISSGTDTYITSNAASVSGAWNYSTTSLAAYYSTALGQHRWYTAPSGTAGTAITFTQVMLLDANGNLGLGVTPSAWRSTADRTLQLNGTALTGYTNYAATLTNNAYLNSSSNWIYIASSVVPNKLELLNNGGFGFNIASSGTAGTAITWTQAMTLDASGFLAIGATTAIKRLTVAGTGGSNVLAIQRTNTNSSGSCGGVGFARETGYFNAAIELVATSSVSGDLVFRTEASSTETEIFNVTERLRITSAGGISFGSSGTAYGSSGQILSSNGNAAPTWIDQTALGVGQTYQDVTASRAFATTYTNSTGKTIFVSAYSTTGTSAGTITFTVAGSVLGRQGISAGASCTCRLSVTFAVPAGATYSVEIGNGTNTLTSWFELR